MHVLHGVCTESSTLYTLPAVTVRLANGTSNSGRLEVWHGGEWGSVCTTSFDPLDAYVACNQLLPGTYGAINSSDAFGPGQGRIWLSNLACSGSESKLESCSHSSWGYTAGCDHSMDVGLTCLPLPPAPNGEWAATSADLTCPWSQRHSAPKPCSTSAASLLQ